MQTGSVQFDSADAVKKERQPITSRVEDNFVARKSKRIIWVVARDKEEALKLANSGHYCDSKDNALRLLQSTISHKIFKMEAVY